MALEKVVTDGSIPQNLEAFLLVLSVSLGVASLSRLFAAFRNIPYSLLLVVVGLGLALFDVRLFDLKPDVTLYVFLPLLLFKTAWKLDWPNFRQDLGLICLFGLGSSLVTLAALTLSLEEIARFPRYGAWLLAASLVATSTSPITTLFQQLGMDQRLRTLIGGENLINAGIAIAVFIVVLDLPRRPLETSWISILGRVLSFIGIGLAVGILLGLAVSYILRQATYRDFLSPSLLLVAAYGSYLMSDELGGSGVIAVVSTSVLLSNFSFRQIETAEQQSLTDFLDQISFVLNSIIFLLIGDQINFTILAENIQSIGISIVALLLARAVSIYGLGALANRSHPMILGWKERTVLWWSGLRGSVSIALSLSIPPVFIGSQAIESVVFGVVLFTLLVQGLTAKPLVQRLGFLEKAQLKRHYLEITARQSALWQMLAQIEEDLELNSWQTQEILDLYRERIRSQLGVLSEEIQDLHTRCPELKPLLAQRLRETLQQVEMRTYSERVQEGLLDSVPASLIPSLELDDVEQELI